MECLAKVRDGSAKEIGVGYWIDTVVTADVNSLEIVPLVHSLYSQNAEDFVSENRELINVIEKVPPRILEEFLCLIVEGIGMRFTIIY